MTRSIGMQVSKTITAWAGAAAVISLALADSAKADALRDLAETASKGPEILWYESSKESQIDNVIAAFNKQYSNVKVKHIRVVGGNKMAGRVVQEVQGRGYTADLVTAGAAQTWALNDRNFLLKTDWSKLGVPKKVTPTDFAVAIAASVYVILVNTRNVPAEEQPKSWDDLTKKKWMGRIGGWVRAGAHTQMSRVWGQEKAEAELKKFVALKPFLFKSTFPMAQQVAAGEVDVAIGFFHTAQPPISAGAPLKRIALDPAPMHTIYTAVTKSARNEAGAMLFLSWLVTSTGAKAYEDATNRGSHLLEGTRTHALVKEAKTAEYPAAETGTYREVATKFNKILSSAGAVR